MRLVMFLDDKMFQSGKLWDIQDVKQKFPHSELELVNAAFVTVKAPDGKVLQNGVMVSGDSEYDIMRKYMGLRDGRRRE